MSTSLPTLAKRNANGKVQLWNVWVKGHVIHRSMQQDNGKVRLMELIECKGKSIGKKNETTPEQQAQLEAKSLWSKKKEREGYVERSELSDEKPTTPMLAKTFAAECKKVNYPVYVQPKLDGIRVLMRWENGQVVALSRKNTPYPFLEHIKKDVSNLLQLLPTNSILDGEIYSDQLKCQDIAGIVATKSEPHPNEKQLKYVIFDIIQPAFYLERYKSLQDAFKVVSLKNVELIETHEANSPEDIEKWHAKWTQYEGVMVRRHAFPYESKRSSSLLKLKKFLDDEFKIIDVVEGQGQDKGCATFIVATGEGANFSARMMGSLEDRQAAFTNRANLIGKLLTVKYQELTKDGIPRFPVGVCIREYE
jgi:DNA ligase 1